MWFAILGPLLVHDGERPVDVPKGRQRVLLGALLMQAGNPVPADALAEMVWDGSPPSGAAVTLRSHVLRLRRVLGPRAGARLATRHPGYLLQAGEDEVDVLRFRSLCRDGGAAVREGAWTRAAGLVGEALGLWRGAPLADVPCELLLREQAPGLEELRLQAEEWRTDAALRLGRHDELIPGLVSLAAQHPLRERFHGQLMLALYRSGRQAEALAAYQRARETLVGELGAEPGPGLRELHQRMLSADPALALADAMSPAINSSQAGLPRELPAGVPHFTGREHELTALTRKLDHSGTQGTGAIVISAIGGTAGVGKTALAVHWARRVADRFPDGQLYVNLRGYDPGQPLPPADALAGFLRSLGVSGQDVPPEAEQCAARYRTLLEGKRMLVVLDNAGSADQVRPLLPGTPACTVLVTSRDALSGLVARDGATRLDLDVLPLEDAVALLRRLIGARVDAEPDAAGDLARQCCRLPLALRVAAELAASRPDMPLSGLVGELADLHTRLDLLAAGGDPHAEVRTVFSWSYCHLDADAAWAFRLLGLHPGPDFDAYAAAALTGITLPQAGRALDVLDRAHLIQPATTGRYSTHDLLRSYARELAAAQETEKERHAALTRLFDHYLHTAAAAMDTLFPAERHRRPRIPRPTSPVPPLADSAAAREWLDRERPTLIATIGHTTTNGWSSQATRLAATLFRYLYSGSHVSEALVVYNHALGAARQTGDRAAEATVLDQLGLFDFEQGHLDQAAANHRQALGLFLKVGDRAGEAQALTNIGRSETALGHYQQAACHHEEALVIFRDIGDRFGEARALGSLGLARRRQGRYEQAAGHYQQTLDLCREIGDRDGEAWALARLGVVELRMGRYQHAARYLEPALALFREMGLRGGESEVLLRTGELCVGLGHYEQAAGSFQAALAIAREIGEPGLKAEALNGLGDVLFQTGSADRARTQHVAALRLASEVGLLREQARAYSGLARICQADEDSLQARHHWQEALSRYTTIGVPEADEIRARLASTADVAAADS